MTTTHGWRGTGRARTGRRAPGLGLLTALALGACSVSGGGSTSTTSGPAGWIGRQPGGIPVHDVERP